uniref:Uncharacterized protein n=2 Tax=Odontella aurita TaxID=265563 RepID=A0A6U6GMW5_9STRA
MTPNAKLWRLAGVLRLTLLISSWIVAICIQASEAVGDGSSRRAMEGGKEEVPQFDPVFFGCGRTDLNASRSYGHINREMHRGMAIKFTGSAEYDFLAGMIPHHSAAMEMCKVWREAAATTATDGSEGASQPVNAGIESLCYNITEGPVSRGPDQYDFSQPGENEQMLDVIDKLGMMDHYNEGCSALSEEGRSDDADQSGHGMFMGCGELNIDSTREYMLVNMDMHMRMALNFTGNPDVDFLLGMIPHHEGAIDMCHIYYRYWSCAPQDQVCAQPSPLGSIETLTEYEEESIRLEVLQAVHHICGGHILETQPPELTWMGKELRRISPGYLVAYNAMKSDSTYPCKVQHGGDHGDVGMGDMDMGHSDGGHTMTDSGSGKDNSASSNHNMTMGGVPHSKENDGHGDGGHTMANSGSNDSKDTKDEGEEVMSGSAARCPQELPHLFGAPLYFGFLLLLSISGW